MKLNLEIDNDDLPDMTIKIERRTRAGEAPIRPTNQGGKVLKWPSCNKDDCEAKRSFERNYTRGG